MEGKNAVFMHLHSDENDVRGYYCHQNVGRAINLLGKLDGALLDSQESYLDETTDRIIAKIKGSNIIGTWKSPNGSKSFPLNAKVQ